MVTIIKFVLWVLLLYYGFRLLGQLLFKGAISRLQKAAEEQYRRQSGYEPERPVGDIRIEKNGSQQQRSGSKSTTVAEQGEYVDYEEVK